jgi:large subunit ribosomal protein L17
MCKNMVQALIEHERIVTTVEKAKHVQPLAEKIIHLAKEDSLNNVRRVVSLAGNRNLEAPSTEKESSGEGKDAVTKERVTAKTTIQKLFREIGPRVKERKGGYTRIIRLARRRLGDNASQCIFELTDSPWTTED